MRQFKKGLGWKACYDDERNLYTAQTSWRGDYHLYQIDADIYNQLGEPGIDCDELIRSGRHLYYSEDNPIGPPTDMVIDENYAELTDIAVELWDNEATREQRKLGQSVSNDHHVNGDT